MAQDKRWVLTAIGATVIGVSASMLVSPAAWADNLEADPATPSAGPVAAGGIRPDAVQGDLRESGDQGVVRNSMKAVPGTKATPQISDLAATDDWNCLEDWSDHC